MSRSRSQSRAPVHSLLAVLLGFSPLSPVAQDVSSPRSVPEQPVFASALEAVPTVLERGPHHRVESWMERVTLEDGSMQDVPHSYTVLATGMHRRESEADEWQDTVTEFVPVAGGFVASRGPHQVAVSDDLFVEGAVTVGSPEGVEWRSTPLSLALRDGQGNVVVLAVNNYQSLPGTANVWLPALSGIFQTVGKGAHYLAGYQVTHLGVAHQLRNAGTDAIDASLKAELTRATTFPPLIRTVAINSPSTFSATAWRDEDQLDLGYHYWPLDYAWSDLVASSDVTFTNGVVIAHYGIRGTQLAGGASLVGEGRPQEPNRFCWYNAVQELPEAWGAAGSTRKVFSQLVSGTPRPKVQLRFTAGTFLADSVIKRYFVDGASHPLAQFDLRDCQFSSAYLYLTTGAASPAQSLTWVNNLFRRSTLGIYSYASDLRSVTFRHNLVHQGGITLYQWAAPLSGALWTVKDNFFDGASVGGVIYSSYYFHASHNAYSAASAFYGGSNNQVSLVANYQAGPLGPYYYPDSGSVPTLGVLLNAGSTEPKDEGLYHFTTRVGQANPK